MKTVIFDTIDGHKIVRGFSRLSIEPVDTARAVAAAIKDTSEWKALEDKKTEHGNAQKKAIAARRSVRVRINKKLQDNPNLTRDNVLETLDITTEKHKWEVALQDMKTAAADMKGLAMALAAKETALKAELAVYFEPSAREAVKDEKALADLSEALGNCPAGCFIDLDGNTVKDNRGRVYFKRVSGKWRRVLILKLGDTVPSGGVLAEDVTDAQRGEIEADRVAELTEGQKAAEKEKAMTVAINAAADMRSRLEIQGDPDALKKSKDWHQAETKRIQGLYG
jgi:hypothetical protein